MSEIITVRGQWVRHSSSSHLNYRKRVYDHIFVSVQHKQRVNAIQFHFAKYNLIL
jgi:hypothetical protein